MFTLEEQNDNVGNQITDYYNPGVNIPTPIGTTDIFNSLSREKEAPQNLAEDVNNASYKSGATILVIDRNEGDEIKYITNKFYLRSMSFNSQEKAQLLETFDVPNVSFFGQRLKVYQFNGNTVEYPSTDQTYKTMQHSSLMQLYENHLRATKLVDNNHMGVLKINNHLVYGYPIQLSSSYSSGADKIVSFNLSWVVAEHTLTLSGIANSEELSSLYDGSYEENELRKQYIQTINNILFPIQKVFNIEYTIDSSEDIQEEQTFVFNPLNTTKTTYTELIENNQDVFDTLLDNVSSSIDSIKTTRVASSDVASILLEWSKTKTDALYNKAGRAKASWEEFQKLQTSLGALNRLKIRLENFKLQLQSAI